MLDVVLSGDVKPTHYLDSCMRDGKGLSSIRACLQAVFEECGRVVANPGLVSYTVLT